MRPSSTASGEPGTAHWHCSLSPSVMTCQPRRNQRQLPEKPLEPKEALTPRSLHRALGPHYIKPRLPDQSALFHLACLGNHNFQFFPLLKLPGIKIFACCLGKNATETTAGKSDFKKPHRPLQKAFFQKPEPNGSTY